MKNRELRKEILKKIKNQKEFLISPEGNFIKEEDIIEYFWENSEPRDKIDLSKEFIYMNLNLFKKNKDEKETKKITEEIISYIEKNQLYYIIGYTKKSFIDILENFEEYDEEFQEDLNQLFLKLKKHFKNKEKINLKM